MSVIIKGTNFGSEFVAAGTLNFYGQGWPPHKYYQYIPGFDFSGATLISKTATIEERMNPEEGKGNMPLNSETLQPKERRPKCIYVDFLRGNVFNAVSLSGQGLKDLLDRKEWQKLEDPFFLSFITVRESHKKRSRECRNLVNILRPRLPEFKSPFGIEVNISCPNVDKNQLDMEAVDQLKIISELGLPQGIKINNLIKIETILRIIDSGLCDFINLPNSFPVSMMPEYIRNKVYTSKVKELINRYGDCGYSGRLQFGPTVNRIAKIRAYNNDIPIIGGSVYHKNQVDILKEAGANAIAVGAVSIVRPRRVKGIIKRSRELFG